MINEKNPKKGESLLDKILSKKESDTPFKRPLVFSEGELLDQIEKLLPGWCDTFFKEQAREVSLSYANPNSRNPGLVDIGQQQGCFSLPELAKHLRKRIEELIKAYK